MQNIHFKKEDQTKTLLLLSKLCILFAIFSLFIGCNVLRNDVFVMLSIRNVTKVRKFVNQLCNCRFSFLKINYTFQMVAKLTVSK